MRVSALRLKHISDWQWLIKLILLERLIIIKSAQKYTTRGARLIVFLALKKSNRFTKKSKKQWQL